MTTNLTDHLGTNSLGFRDKEIRDLLASLKACFQSCRYVVYSCHPEGARGSGVTERD